MMSSSRSLTFAVIASITLAGAGCVKKEAPAVTSSQAPPLPADVEKVSAAVNPPSTTSSVSSEGGTSSVSGLATETGGTILATGELVSPVRSELAVKMPGRVGKVFVDEGQRVSKGQPLLELETDYIRLNLERASAESARARSAAEEARKDFERKKELLAKSSIPQAVYDRSQAAMEQSDAALRSANASANLLRQQLSDAVLRSPINGAVAEKRTDVGQRMGDNTVAFVLVQTAPLKLRFRVPERYLQALHTGQPVTATVDSYAGEKFEGKVSLVGQVVDPATRSLLVESEFANRDGRLRPGMFARVEVNSR
jgi:RND family efflux transporter MFP subunit